MKDSPFYPYILDGDKNEFDVHLKNFLFANASLNMIYEITSKSLEFHVDTKSKSDTNTIKDEDKDHLQQIIQSIENRDAMKFRNLILSDESKLTKELVEKAFMQLFSTSSGDFFREMVLTYFITIFETFLQFCLETIFLMKPESLKSGDKTISYSEVIDHIDNLNHYIALQESKKILRKNIDEIAEYLDKSFHLSIKQYDDWDAFREYFFRRNTIVHNNNFPDSEYREHVNYSGPQTRLIVTDDYIKNLSKIFTLFAKNITEFFSEKYGKKYHK